MADILDTGVKYAGSATTLARSGSNELGVWTNVGNVVGSGTNITTNFPNKDSYSNYLRVYNYGMGIPENATMTGIAVQISRRCTESANRVYDSVVSLYNSGVVGTNKASATTWAGSFQTPIYGGNTDLWGLSLTPAEVNATGFGMVLSNRNANPGGSGEVRWIRITGYYLLGGNAKSIIMTAVIGG